MVIDNTDQIAELNDVLAVGLTRAEVDGQVSVTDMATLKEERRRLIETDTTLRHSRPRVARIDLSQGP